MVRINLVKPEKLADQHLIAEYNEILMLFGYVRKNPEIKEIPQKYCLGKGHIKYFKNKLVYLQKRHEIIKKEMRKRGFKTDKVINLEEFSKELWKDWKPKSNDLEIIKDRLKYKIKLKEGYYRYYGKVKEQDFFLKLLK